jgi:hypothetical protein
MYDGDEQGDGNFNARTLIIFESLDHTLERLFLDLWKKWLRLPGLDLSKPLDLAEECWCAWALASYEVRCRFATEEWHTDMERDDFEGAKFLSLGRPANSGLDENELLISLRGLGLQTVKDALSTTKYWNRKLIMNGPMPPEF